MLNDASYGVPRPPVVAVMGHIDHGKSTLLDYIRRANVAESELGGITQRLGAYEVAHKTAEGNTREITFLDTPGHEAFASIRKRGANVADVAVLVVSAEDGVKPQTLDALRAIKDSGTPFVVAINKIDKPNASIERTKQSLAENEIYVEGYGGDITVVPVSAKTGEGINELLDMILLTADVVDAKGIRNEMARGIVIEAQTTERSGVVATIVIKNGTLNIGDVIVSGDVYAPVRFIENFKGEKIKSASFSSPVRISGWSGLPKTGTKAFAVKTRKEAEKMIEEYREEFALTSKKEVAKPITEGGFYIPIIIKADAQGALDAIAHEIKKIENSLFKIVHSDIGNIRESDVKLASAKAGTVILGYGVGTDKEAEILRERLGVNIKHFGIIYELGDYLKELNKERTPKVTVEELQGSLKVLKFFSKTKDKQVIGGRVESGKIEKNAMVKIMRRDHQVGEGCIREIQVQKVKTGEASEGNECGLLVEAKLEIAPGDKLESYTTVEK